jgi:hypothetical protein
VKPVPYVIPEAVNDRGAGVVAIFGLPVDFDPAVMIHAASPRGRRMQFAIPASSASRESRTDETVQHR